MPIGLNNTDIQVDYGGGNVFNVDTPKYLLTTTTEVSGEEIPNVNKSVLTRTQYDTGSDVTSGLIAHYKFDGDLTDSSGNGNHITTTSGTIDYHTIHRISGQSSLIGANEYIEITSLNVLTAIWSGAFTISFWLYPTTSDKEYLVGGWDNAASGGLRGGWYITARNGNLELVGLTGGSFPTIIGTDNNIVANAWNHISISNTGTTFNISLNGIVKTLIASNTLDTPHTNIADRHISISRAKRWGGSGYDYDNNGGYYDDFRIYNRVLSPTEITDLYNLGAVNIEEGDISGTNEKYIAYKYIGGNDNGSGQSEYNLHFNNPVLCDILVVAGGGAGGGNGQGGGGGAGALIYYEDIILHGDYTIKVGNGGTNGNTANVGDSGSDSEFKRTSDSKQQFLAKGGGGGSFNFRSGLKYEYYNQGYFADNVNWFNSYSPVATGYVTDGTNIGTFSNNTRTVNSGTYYSFEWTGYFKSSVTGTYIFYTQSDDASYCWVGSNAISGFTTSNALVNNGGGHSVRERSGSINLTANTYYPIRYQHGQGSGSVDMRVSFTPPGGSRTYNGDGYFYSYSIENAGNDGGSGGGGSASGKLIAGNIVNDIPINIVSGSATLVDHYNITMFPGDKGVDSLNDIGCFGNYGGIEMSGGHDDWGAGGGGAGGGGAGTKGDPTSESAGVQKAGDGGSGKKYNITGTEVYYAAGGGGGIRPGPGSLSIAQVGSGGLGGGGAGGGGGDGTTNSALDSSGVDAEPHTGSGGGGVGAITSANYKGGNGGSGIVVVRYKNENISNDAYIPQGDNATEYTILDCDSRNLVAHYKFDEGAEYRDSVNGYYDLIDIDNNSLFSSSEKVFGKSAHESGTEAKIQFPNSIASQISEISSTTGITFSFWFNMNTSSGSWASLFEFSDTASDTTSTNRIGISRNGTANSIWIGIKEDNVTTSITCGVVDNKWHHIIWSIDNRGTWQVYFDGVNQYPYKYKQIPQIINYDYSYLFGSVQSSQTNGYIDDFRFYNKVLNPLEINYLANKSIKLVPKEIDSEYNLLTFLYHDGLTDNNQTEYNLTFDNPTECDILIVAGGGAGGYDRAGGGGAGGLVFQQNVSLTGQVNIKVGKGGVINSDDTIPGGNGSDSSINDIIALGGGGGAGEQAVASDGGSGGGSSYKYDTSHYGAGLQPTQTPNIGYGNSGGDARNLSSTSTSRGGGGGGGAGGSGLRATSASVGGAGGVGLSGIGDIDFKDHFGLPTSGIGEYIVAENKIYFAGGGGAGECIDTTSDATTYGIGGKGGGSDGKETDNTIEGAMPNSGGGGGGGGNVYLVSRGHGSNGGSGVVLVRYKKNMGSPTITTELAQWKYSATNANVSHMGNVGIGTIPLTNYNLNVKGDISTNNLYKDGCLIGTGKVKELDYSFPYFTSTPNVSSTKIPGTSYKYITFVYDPNNDNGSGQTEYNFDVLSDMQCDILIVGGGGGGGAFGGGGGGGGLLFTESALLRSNKYTIKVGNGGAGAPTYNNGVNGTNGYNSSININDIDYIAVGGGGGGTRKPSPYDGTIGNAGGSGGGGSHSNTTAVSGGTSTQLSYFGWQSYGNSGGKGRDGTSGGEPSHSSGGGGGAGYMGEDAIQSTQGDRTFPTYGGGGDGGIGMDFSSYFGTNIGHNGWFAGGGGGQTYNNVGRVGWGNSYNGTHDNIRGFGGGGDGGFNGSPEINPQKGMSHTGGGGGGAQTNKMGASGGSGIVIIRYLDSGYTNEPTITNNADNNLLVTGSNDDVYNIMSFKYLNDVITDMHPTFSQDAAHLIAHYKFDGNYEDSNPQSTKYHLTNVGTELVEDGYIKSVLIDSDSDELYTTDNMPAITSTSTYSWCCWVKRNEERHGINHFVFSQGVNSSTTEIGVAFVNNNTLRFYVHSYDLDITISFNDTAFMSGYNHFVFTINNNTTKIYENGILRGSRSVSANVAANKLYIGKRADLSGSFRGNVADFRVYDKELSADEVYELYTLYNGQTPYSVTFSEDTECDILVVGGGGGGGIDGQGGGGGGIININKFIMTANTNYTIKIGNGGNGSYDRLQNGFNGLDSQILNDNGDIIFSGNGGLGGKSKFIVRLNGGGSYTTTTLNGTNWQQVWSGNNYLAQLSFIEHVEKNIIFKVNNPSGATIQYKSSLDKTGGFRYQVPGNARINVNSYISSWTTVNLPDQTIFGFISGSGIRYDVILFTDETAGEGGSYNITSDVSYIYESIETYDGKIGSTSLNINNGVDGVSGYNINNDNIIYGSSGYGIGYTDTTNPITINNTGIGGSSGDITTEAVYPRNGGSGIVIIRYKATLSNPITYRLKEWRYNTYNPNSYFMGNVGIGVTNPSVALEVAGTITKTSLSFKIQHPLNNNKWLYHNSLEGPRYDNIYRGKKVISGGYGEINIDADCNTTGGMATGTFATLIGNPFLYLRNNQTFDNVIGYIDNGIIKVNCENTSDDIEVEWMVIGERKDNAIKRSQLTDNQGRLLCERQL